MFFLVLLFILLLNGVLSQQGIFEPYTFTESNCRGNYKWTTWYDTNDPTSLQGDHELTNHIQQLFPDYMCSLPIAIEV